MIREIDDVLYEAVREWWVERNKTPFFPRGLSPKRGYISYINGNPAMAGFLYVSDDLTMGFIAYLVSPPEASKLEKEAGFEDLQKEFEKQAKDLNIKFLFTTTNQSSLSNKIRNSGFIECDTDVVHFLKPIKGE